MTPSELAERNAKTAGRKDRVAGRDCDPTRYGAMHNSAWANWYRQGYDE